MLKPETIRKRLLEAAIAFGQAEVAIRAGRRQRRRCEEASEGDRVTPAELPCFKEPELPEADYCPACLELLAIRTAERRKRRQRQLAKEQMVRLVKRLEAAHG